MKKIISILIIIGLVITITGCGNGIKNPKTIELEKGKVKTEVTYPKDDFKLSKVGERKAIANENKNYRIIFGYENKTIKEQNKEKERLSKIKSTITDDIKINGYKGYMHCSKVFGSTQVYLYLDNDKDIIFSARINPINSDKVIKKYYDKKTNELKKGTNAKDIFYNRDEIQKILKTIKYKK